MIVVFILIGQLFITNSIEISEQVKSVVDSIDRTHFNINEFGSSLTNLDAQMMALELLKPNLLNASKCLDIGSGTGYMTLAMKKLMSKVKHSMVFGLDHIYELAGIAEQAVIDAGYGEYMDQYKIVFVTGEGKDGLSRHKPIDCINVGVAFKEIPHVIIDQLRNGGRMVIPIDKQGSQVLTVIDKDLKGKVTMKDHKLDQAAFPLISSLLEQCPECVERYELAKKFNEENNGLDKLLKLLTPDEEASDLDNEDL